MTQSGYSLAIDRKQLIKVSDATLSAAQKQSHVTQPVSYQFYQSFAGMECEVVTQVYKF